MCRSSLCKSILASISRLGINWFLLHHIFQKGAQRSYIPRLMALRRPQKRSQPSVFHFRSRDNVTSDGISFYSFLSLSLSPSLSLTLSLSLSLSLFISLSLSLNLLPSTTPPSASSARGLRRGAPAAVRRARKWRKASPRLRVSFFENH